MPECQIAIDAAADAMPVNMRRSIQLNLQAVNGQAEIVLKNENQAKIEDQHGNMRTVVDEGGTV